MSKKVGVVAKPTKQQDRRAVIEQMRREQQSAEKKRTLAMIGAAVVVGLVIIGLGAYPLIKDSLTQDKLAKQDLSGLGVSAAAAKCTDAAATKATGSADHRAEGSKLPYTDSPPATGPHYPVAAPMTRKFYTAKDRPEVGYLVHNLEHGYNILWYDETVAKDDQKLAAVKAIAEKFTGTDFTDKFIAAPWTAEDGDPFPERRPRRPHPLVDGRHQRQRQGPAGHHAVLRAAERRGRGHLRQGVPVHRLPGARRRLTTAHTGSPGRGSGLVTARSTCDS